MPLPPDYYQKRRDDIADLVPKSARRVLDVGCAEGVLGPMLFERGAKEVIGIELVPEVAKRARKRLTRVLCGDVSTMRLPKTLGSFECIVLADVLEHVTDPGAVLGRLLPHLAADGMIVASIPNVRHHSVLSMLADGSWTYQDAGIMDRGHLRFFTFKEIKLLFESVGLEIRGLFGRIDPEYEQARAAGEGKAAVDLTFGRVTLRQMTPSEVVELYLSQYVFTAGRRPAA